MGNKSTRRNTKIKCRSSGRSRRVAVHPGRERRNDADEQRRLGAISLRHGVAARIPGPTIIAPETPPARNEPCPCGSGTKWKRCCGAAERTD